MPTPHFAESLGREARVPIKPARFDIWLQLAFIWVQQTKARKDLRRASFDVWLKSAFSWVHRTQQTKVVAVTSKVRNQRLPPPPPPAPLATKVALGACTAATRVGGGGPSVFELLTAPVLGSSFSSSAKYS